MLIEGIFAAIPTPFYPDERVYYRKLEANMARYSRTLLAGVVVLGSTGEAPLLSDAEQAEVLRIAAEAAAPEKVLIAGVGRESVRGTLELVEVATKARYDAVLVRPPSYYGTLRTPEAQLHYFRAVADRSPLPVILYNVPNCVPQEIPVEVVAQLANHPNIIAIKDSAGSVDRIQAEVEATKNAPKRTVTVTPVFEAVTARMQSPKVSDASTGPGFVPASELAAGQAVASSSAIATPPPPPALKTRTKEVGFQVLCGSATIVLDALEAGASGGILAFASFAPEACQEIYMAWKDHDPKLARAKQERIAAVNRRIVSELGIGALKYACDFNGYFGGHPRSPLVAPTAETKREIEGLLEQIRN
jgi:dihydrodipicolinate synthase/N-acetylneuraminate lyase